MESFGYCISRSNPPQRNAVSEGFHNYMKLVSFLSRGVASYGILEGTQIRDIGHALRGQWPDLKTMLGQDYRKIASETRASAPVLDLSEVELLVPVPNPT